MADISPKVERKVAVLVGIVSLRDLAALILEEREAMVKELTKIHYQLTT
jgi:hypothetical protein